MTFVYLGCFCLALFSAYYYSKDIFSPARLFVCVYSLLLAVNSLHLSGYQTPWALTTHFFFWGATICFVAGALIIHSVNSIRNPLVKVDFGSIRAALRADALALDWRWFFLVWAVCASIFLVSYLESFLISGIIPMFSKAATADKARMAFIGASLPTNYGLFFGPLSLILGAEQLLFGKGARRRMVIILIVSLVALLAYITMITRLDLFRFMLFAVILYHYGKKKLTLGQLFSAAGLFALAFLFFFFLRVQYDTLGLWADAQKLHVPREFLWCANMYTYVVNNFWNFDYAIRKYVDGVYYYPQQWGFSLARAFFGMAFLATPFEQSYGFDSIMNESATMLKGINTVIYVWHFFKDFGAFGVFFLPLLFGMLLTVFHVNTLNAPSLLRVAIWAQVAPLIILSYSFALWEFWFVYVNFLFIALAHRRLRKRRTGA